MGRARSDGYPLNGSSQPGPRTSTTNGKLDVTSSQSKSSVSSRSSRPAGSGRSRDGHRMSRNRRPRDQGCRNPQVRKGVASVVFVLGIPCLIAGIILTIVSSTDEGEENQKYPSSFNVAGPLMIALSVICFIVGVLLYNIVILQKVRDCMNLSDKDSFCRVHCPRFSAWIKPDALAALNRAAINNLQTAPARSAMRKLPNPDLVALETGGQGQGEGQGEGHSHYQQNHTGHHHNNHHHHHYHHHHHHSNQDVPHVRRKRAVTFSEGDSEPERAFFKLSASSEPDRFSLQSDTAAAGGGLNGSLNGQSPSSSLLSLRHCKIHPKDDVFWTDSSGGGPGGNGSDNSAGGVGRGGEGGGGGGGAEINGGSGGGGHPTAADAINVHDNSSDISGVVDPIVPVKFSLTDIDEERA